MKQLPFLRMAIGAMVMAMTACQTTNDPLVEVGGHLIWQQTDSTSNGADLQVQLEADQSDSVVLNLRIKQTGMALPDQESITFRVDDLKSSAVAGRQVVFPQGRIATIPAGQTESGDIPIEIRPEHIKEGSNLELVLYLEASDHIPVPSQGSLRELTIRISKAPKKLPITFLKLKSPGSNTGMTMLDLSELKVYTRREANIDENLQSKIDFGFWNSSSRDFVFMVPTDSERLGAWGSGKVIRDEWAEENKNDGILIRLPQNAANDALFTGAETPQALLDAFEIAEQRVGSFDPYDYGPGGHLHDLQTGDIIFFESLSRDLHAILRVDAATSGNSGTMELSVKRIRAAP